MTGHAARDLSHADDPVIVSIPYPPVATHVVKKRVEVEHCGRSIGVEYLPLRTWRASTQGKVAKGPYLDVVLGQVLSQQGSVLLPPIKQPEPALNDH